MRRLRRYLASYAAAGSAGAAFLLAFGRFTNPGDPDASRLGLLLMGFLYGVATGALVRAFPTPPAGYPLAGLLVGPLPVALLWSGGEEGGAVWLLSALLGTAIGVFEWARARAIAREEAAREAADLG